ncbi:MAG: hypothetical protein M1382_02475 [Candidatus Marsarchaeota archaeon]|jgi:nitrite reductase (NO-forming)|nr:hypothetical protein [Candidatus Marsarchaeota archaeon]
MPIPTDNWFYNNVQGIKTTIRIVFGIVWGVDGALKFMPGMTETFSTAIAQAGAGQPAWLGGWFTFWSNIVSSNPAFFVYMIGTLELTLAFALIFGFLRKLAWGGGFLLSFFIWAIPEGFGGAYGPGSTDIGTGIIYAIVFLCLMVFNASFGPSRFSLDYLIEKHWPKWALLAEIKNKSGF